MAALAVVTYWRSLSLPFISDDYLQIWLARRYGPISGWHDLIRDPLYRCRATSLLVTYWTERWFGLTPRPFYWSSLILHVWDVWLVFALGIWRVIGWRKAAVAAAFFAVYERHQEAVIWYAAQPELLVFFFGVLALLFWILWVQSEGSNCWYAAGFWGAFLLALASKESAVAVLGLCLVICWFGETDRRIRFSPRLLLPLGAAVALSAVYAALIFVNQTHHWHFQDGTFSLHAPFYRTWAISLTRMFWLWGLAATAILCHRSRLGDAAVGFAWAGIALFPYCFLTYMREVPSRHTYWASAGLALIVAAAFVELYRTWGRSRCWLLYTVAAVMVTQNAGYIWTRKQQQFEERAAPTERLIQRARSARGPVYLHSFPYPLPVAESAVALEAGNRVIPIQADRLPPNAAAGSILFYLPSGTHMPAFDVALR
ncbi:MAG TPA: hypothetical protein VG675_01780 [Bryobacteraceae bacterium]|nr:hypothetical protein [Bryobacteraceae bacterium]